MITAKEVRERYYARKAEEAKKAGKQKDAEKLLDAKGETKPAPGGETVPLAVRARMGSKTTAKDKEKEKGKKKK